MRLRDQVGAIIRMAVVIDLLHAVAELHAGVRRGIEPLMRSRAPIDRGFAHGQAEGGVFCAVREAFAVHADLTGTPERFPQRQEQLVAGVRAAIAERGLGLIVRQPSQHVQQRRPAAGRQTGRSVQGRQAVHVLVPNRATQRQRAVQIEPALAGEQTDHVRRAPAEMRRRAAHDAQETPVRNACFECLEPAIPCIREKRQQPAAAVEAGQTAYPGRGLCRRQEEGKAAVLRAFDANMIADIPTLPVLLMEVRIGVHGLPK